MSGFLIIECSNGLSLASYYPEFLFPTLCSSRAPDPHLAWLDGHYARRELEEVVCSPSVCSVQSLDGSAQRLWGGHRFSVMGCFDIGLQHFCRSFPHLFLLWLTHTVTNTEVSICGEKLLSLSTAEALVQVSVTISPQCIKDSLERKEHILQNWQGVFWLSDLRVTQLFFGGESFNGVLFRLFSEIPAEAVYTLKDKHGRF